MGSSHEGHGAEDTARTTRVIVLTGNGLRHGYFRKALALFSGIDVVASYCETSEGSVEALVSAEDDGGLREEHLADRLRSEDDFFGSFDRLAPDESRPMSIPRGALNSDGTLHEMIRSTDPDVLVCYGTSIIRGPLLSDFKGRFLNIHLGLSPYYRGSGTNFWPLVNEEPEYVGATFMHIHEGVDTGEVIHQRRASIYRGDGPHQIGNRLIRDVVFDCASLVIDFGKLEPMEQLSGPPAPKYYRKRDFDDEAVRRLRANFANGMIEAFLKDRGQRCREVPIITHPRLGEDV